MSQFETIDVAALEAMLPVDGYRLVDVRNDDEVAAGIIPGAEHVVLNQLPAAIGSFAPDEKIVFYCRSGNRSGQAAAFFANKGYAHISHLGGGMIAWSGAGKPVVPLAK